MAFVQRSGVQQQTFVFQDGSFGRVSEAGLCSTRASRYTRDVLRAALLDVLRNSLLLVTGELQRTLQAYNEFKSSVNTMVNNMDVIEKYLLRKTHEKS